MQSRFSISMSFSTRYQIPLHVCLRYLVLNALISGQIVDLIKDDIKGKIPIAEVYPGLGLITRRLLLAGAEQLLVFDPRPNVLPPLLQLVNDNPTNITVIPSLFYDVSHIIGQDLKDGGDRFETMFKQVSHKDWNDDPVLRVIGVIHNSIFLRYLAKSICFQWPILRLGRIDMFFLMTELLEKQLLRPRGWGRIENRIIFHAFFDFKVLGEFPRVGFLPWDKGKVPIHERVVKLVQVTPKRDLLERYSPDQLKTLWFFVHELTRCKTSSVISVFEKWIPGSGVKLIEEGITLMTLVEDLTVPDIVHLFHVFIAFPEFDECDFLHIQETNFLNDEDEQLDEKSANTNGSEL